MKYQWIWAIVWAIAGWIGVLLAGANVKEAILFLVGIFWGAFAMWLDTKIKYFKKG